MAEFKEWFDGSDEDYVFDEHGRVSKRSFVQAVGMFVVMKRRHVRIGEIAVAFNCSPRLAMKAVGAHPAGAFHGPDDVGIERRLVRMDGAHD